MKFGWLLDLKKKKIEWGADWISSRFTLITMKNTESATGKISKKGSFFVRYIFLFFFLWINFKNGGNLVYLCEKEEANVGYFTT